MDANLRVVAWIAALAIPVNVLVMLAPSGEWAMVWLAPGAALMSAPYGVAAAALHGAIPASMRSQVTALYLLIVNIVGASIGPTLTAVLTQRVFGREDSLNLSLLVVHVFALGSAALLLWAGRKPYLETIKRRDYVEPVAVRG
jgi:MFS family permease